MWSCVLELRYLAGLKNIYHLPEIFHYLVFLDNMGTLERYKTYGVRNFNNKNIRILRTIDQKPCENLNSEKPFLKLSKCFWHKATVFWFLNVFWKKMLEKLKTNIKQHTKRTMKISMPNNFFSMFTEKKKWNYFEASQCKRRYP